MVELLPALAAALVLATLPLIAALLIRRIRVAYRERRHARLERRVEPLALRLVDGEDADPAADPLRSGEGAALAEVLTRYAQVLNGTARARIAEFFERSGAVAEQERRLRSRRPWRRAIAAKTLGDMRSAAACEALVSCLDDEDAAVRSTAARSLGKLGDLDAVEPLVNVLADGSAPHAVAGYALLELGSGAVPTLVNLLESDREEVRAVAVELIGRLGCARDAALLVECLDDDSAEVRARASRALGRLGAGPAVAKLRRALVEPVPFIRAAAAVGIGRAGDTESLDTLLEHARIDSFASARAAARAASEIAPQQVAEIGDANPSAAGAHLVEAADRIAWGLD